MVKKNLPERQLESVSLKNALGKILAKDIRAVEPSPRYTNSAMDGFAVCWDDVKTVNESGPVELAIAGESQAGIPYEQTLQAGQAARISTGAMLCKGADTVVPIEEVEINGNTLRVLKANKFQQHLRFVGEEFETGELLLSKGVLLNPARMAVLASQGITEVPVYQTPSVAIILTGTELVPYDSTVKPWQIRDSNGIMLETAIQESGGTVLLNAHVADNYEDTVKAVQQASANVDLILFSGGVSVGPHDLVKKAASECGFETLFWRVRQKPGKPLFFARKNKTLFFGLPGNPVSAYMCYLFYVHPVLQYLQGKRFSYRKISGKLASSIENNINRAQLFRVSLENQNGSDQYPIVHPLNRQGSHMLTSISDASGFVFIDVNTTLRQGELVEVIAWNE